jgi:hypothetical protein
MLRNNTWVMYDGYQPLRSGTNVKAAILCQNQISADERNYLRRFSVTVDDPVFRKHRMGTIRFQHGIKAGIIADKQIQTVVSTIGRSLIPASQNTIADNDPTKIAFRFYVVKAFNNPLRDYLIGIDQTLPRVGRLKYTFSRLSG